MKTLTMMMPLALLCMAVPAEAEEYPVNEYRLLEQGAEVHVPTESEPYGTPRTAQRPLRTGESHAPQQTPDLDRLERIVDNLVRIAERPCVETPPRTAARPQTASTPPTGRQLAEAWMDLAHERGIKPAEWAGTTDELRTELIREYGCNADAVAALSAIGLRRLLALKGGGFRLPQYEPPLEGVTPSGLEDQDRVQRTFGVSEARTRSTPVQTVGWRTAAKTAYRNHQAQAFAQSGPSAPMQYAPTVQNVPTVTTWIEPTTVETYAPMSYSAPVQQTYGGVSYSVPAYSYSVSSPTYSAPVRSQVCGPDGCFTDRKSVV